MAALVHASRRSSRRFRWTRLPTLTTAVAGVFLFTVVALPAGTVAGVPVKQGLFLATLVLFVVDVLARRRVERSALRAAVGAAVLMTLLLVWFALGLARGSTEPGVATMALSSFGTTVLVAALIGALCAAGRLTPSGLAGRIIVAASAFALLKAIAATLLLVGAISYDRLHAFVSEVLNYEFVSMLIAPGLVRMHFVNDVFAPFAMLLVLLAPRLGVRIGKPVAHAVLVLLGLSIALSYSRFLMLAAVVLYLLWFATTGRQRRSTLVVATAALLFGMGVVASTDPVRGFVTERFFSEPVIASDSIRDEQRIALLAEVERYPFLGKGIGGYVEDTIRSESHPYSYELQWLSIVLQVGLVGLSVLAAFLAGIGARLIHRRPNALGWTLLGAYLVWLASGLTNPYLLSSAGGAMFGLFLAFGNADTSAHPSPRTRAATGA